MFSDVSDAIPELRPLIACIGKNLCEKQMKIAKALDDERTSIPVLNVRSMNDFSQRKTRHIDEDVPLLALDFLASIVAMRIDADPPFSALLTL